MRPNDVIFVKGFFYLCTALSLTLTLSPILGFLFGGFFWTVECCFSCRLANLKLYNYIKTFCFWGITIGFGGEIVIHYYYSLINYTIPIYIYICLQVLILEIFTVFSFLVSHHCGQSPLLLTFTTWILDPVQHTLMGFVLVLWSTLAHSLKCCTLSIRKAIKPIYMV